MTIVLGGTMFLLHNLVVSVALTIAYAAWLLTRRRMLRVFRRLRGEPDWSAYYDETGERLKLPPAPGRAPSSPRPAERP
jgi:hypothetical protein